MKCTIPEISWHNRDPVLSVDIQPLTSEGFYRLASGGTDSHVLIWHLKILETGATHIEAVSDLTRHQRAVNVVRWSNSGQYLASGDDDANIIIWHQKADDLTIMLDGDNEDKEKWNVFKVLRGHKEDVYDICWSPDSCKLISGSVDNTAIIWDLNKGINDSILTDHKGFVQGVTWDPLGQYVATLSSDRICRVFNETGKQVRARVKKGLLPVPDSHVLHGQIVTYFHDDTLKSFFRRLTFSPDGSLIITPAGCLEMGPNDKSLYASYIYSTVSLTQPAAIIPSPGQYTVAARCCPILFQLHPDGPDPVICLPYRIIFAIATRSSVILYDTQQMNPFATISNIHYTRLTDVTWSQDGRLLAVSSTDGFCSLVTFEPEELGIEYIKEPEVLEEDANETVEEIADTVNISVDEKKEEKKDKKPSFLEMWTKKCQIEDKSPLKRKSDDETKNYESANKKIRSDKPATLIAVRRKPKETEIDAKSLETNIDNVIIVSEDEEFTKKSEIKTENLSSKNKKTENIENQNKIDKPATPIAIRRKPKIFPEGAEISAKSEKENEETTIIKKKISEDKCKEQDEKCSSKIQNEDIAIRKKNEETLKTADESEKEREIEESEQQKEITGVKYELENQNKDEKPATPIAIRSKYQIVVEKEKENIVENVNTPKKDSKNITTPDNKKRSKKRAHITPAKPISARKKPREPPGGQLNITQFLKSEPKSTILKNNLLEAKNAKKSKLNPFILVEDYTKTGKTYKENDNKDEFIAIDVDDSCEISVAKVLNFEDDSQNIKLVLEETQDEAPAGVNKIQKETVENKEVDDGFVIYSKINKNNKKIENLNIKITENKGEIIENETDDNKTANAIDTLNSDDKANSNKTKENESVETIDKLVIGEKESREGIQIKIKEVIQENCNVSPLEASGKKSREEMPTDNEKFTQENCNDLSVLKNLEKNETEIKSTANCDNKTENCKTKSISSNSIQLEIKDDKPTALSNFLSQSKDSPAKKRVPLITLSSPKHKKKPM